MNDNKCKTCNGSGEKLLSKNCIVGGMSKQEIRDNCFIVDCPNCFGTGKEHTVSMLGY